MKYKFTRIDDDTTELSYKDKTFTIKKDIELVKEIQSIPNKARLKMIVDLSKQGLTTQDLVIIKTENGKRYEDKTNLIEIENDYIGITMVEIYNNYIKERCGITLDEMINEMGLDDEEAEQFGLDLAIAIRGETEETPSQKGKQ